MTLKYKFKNECRFLGTSRNYATEAEEARADFSKRIKEMTEASRKALIAIPTWIWKCDTIMSNQKENETYIKFSELLQVGVYD